MRNLWNLKKGQQASIDAFSESLNDDIELRLKELGFEVGNTITCLLKPSFGAPRVFQVNHSIYSLDNEISQLIMISAGDA